MGLQVIYIDGMQFGDPPDQRVGVDEQWHKLDAAKALRAGINKLYGPQHPVQRCRNHKIRNVVERVPEEQRDQGKAAIRAAYRQRHWCCEFARD